MPRPGLKSTAPSTADPRHVLRPLLPPRRRQQDACISFTLPTSPRRPAKCRRLMAAAWRCGMAASSSSRSETAPGRTKGAMSDRYHAIPQTPSKTKGKYLDASLLHTHTATRLQAPCPRQAYRRCGDSKTSVAHSSATRNDQRAVPGHLRPGLAPEESSHSDCSPSSHLGIRSRKRHCDEDRPRLQLR